MQLSASETISPCLLSCLLLLPLCHQPPQLAHSHTPLMLQRKLQNLTADWQDLRFHQKLAARMGKAMVTMMVEKKMMMVKHNEEERAK